MRSILSRHTIEAQNIVGSIREAWRLEPGLKFPQRYAA
jgi:hypothetical protein